MTGKPATPMTTSGMLPLKSGRKSFLGSLTSLYKGDVAFRGMVDFAVIGAVAMMFLNPPHRVKWPWSDSGGSGGQTVQGGGQIQGGGGSPGGNGSPSGSTAISIATTAGPVVAIPFPEMLKSPRLGIGFLFDIDDKAFSSSSAEDQKRLAAALSAIALRNPDDAVEALRSAEGKDANVALLRGAAFVMRNTEAANRSGEALWRQAVNGGSVQAKALLGRLLISGRPGIKANPAEGQKLIEGGIAAGDRQAMRFAGIGYLSGDLGRLDPPKAADLLQQAANKGDAMSMGVYSRMLAEGIGVPSSDGAKAEEYLRRAANAGLTRAQITLGDWVVAQFAQGLVATPQEAIDWFTRAYEKGHSIEALNRLAHLHSAVAKAAPWKDPKKGSAHVRRCSGYLHNTCQYNNAVGWALGHYGAANLPLARAHYEIARSLGQVNAADQVKRIDAALTPAQKEEAAALEKAVRAALKPIPSEIPLQYASIPSPPPPEAQSLDSLTNDKTLSTRTAQANAPAVANSPDYKQCIDGKAEIQIRHDACDRVIKQGKGSPVELAWAHFGRAWCKSRLKQGAEAIADYTEAIKLVPDHVAAINNRGSLHMANRDNDKALADFDKALQINGNHKQALANKAEVLRRQGRLTDALAQVEKSLALDVKFTWARNVRDAIMADLKRLESGKSAPQTQKQSEKPGEKPVVKKSEPDGEIEKISKRAEAHLANKDYDSAIADLTEVIRQGKARWLEYNLRGNAYHYKKQYDLALADYDRAVSRSGHGAAPHYNRALIHRRKGDLDKALTDLDAAITQHLGFVPDYFKERGDIHMQKENYERAVKDYTSMLDLLSKNKSSSKNDTAYAYYLRGRANIEKIESDKKKCMAMIPPSSDCNSSAAFMIPMLDFQAALAFKPNYAAAHFQTGLIAARIGNSQKALESYTNAIKADPNYSMAYNNRGVLYGNSKQRELAFADYNDAIRADPNNKYAWANRAALFAGSRQRRRAIEDYQRALSIDPNYVYAINGLRRLGVRR